MKQIFTLLAIAVVCAAFATIGNAQILSQTVLKFDSKKEYTYRYDKNESAIVLHVKGSSTEDLSALENYDERLIRRVVIKDLGVDGTLAKIILKNANVKAIVSDFSEPFRITIDLFNNGYTEAKDPLTGLPVDNSDAENSAQNDRISQSQPTSRLLVEDAASPQPSNLFAKKGAPKTIKLLQPTPELFQSPEEMTHKLSEIPAGIGKHWEKYPNYIYRIQTASFEGESIRSNNQHKKIMEMNSARAMADYAGNLYNFGHENRALTVYQQVLHKEPRIFEQDALHLWKFSEIQLGQGNLTLANGYYETILDKHPESPLAEFAKLRLLDIKAIRLTQQQRYNSSTQLVSGLNKIDSNHSSELAALKSIRNSFWSDKQNSEAYSSARLPVIDSDVYGGLSASFNAIENKKTKFLAASIMLNNLLENARPWTSSTGKFAADYFDTSNGKFAQPYTSQLKSKLSSKINSTLQEQITQGKLIAAIENYSQLPAKIKPMVANPKTSWALAEAYRKLGQTPKSIGLYETAQKTDRIGPNRFKAQFWLATTSASLAAELKQQNAGQAQIDSLIEKARTADREMQATWASLKENEKNQITIAYKEHFENVITKGLKLRMPAKIVLESWSQALATPASTSNGGETNDWQRHYSPTGGAVLLISDLAKRFSELGMLNERRKARNLLKFMKPSQFADDKAAKDLWANELLGLADDYRKANQSLEAGRLYTLVGNENPNWEGRAKSLYQGGLLLLRSGRKQEAMKALQEASSDGNNLYYSDLAKERLNQIK